MRRESASTLGVLSATQYVACVAVITIVVVAVTMWFRPTLAYSVGEALGMRHADSEVPSNSFYKERVVPVLQEHCVGCHGERRQKGGLRLDTFTYVMLGGKHGSVVTPGRVEESQLVERVLLPVTNDKVMPPAGRAMMKVDEKTVLKLWIAHGASSTRLTDTIPGVPMPEIKVVIPSLDETATASARSAMKASVESLQRRFGAALSYESRESADLVLNASLLGAAFGDAELGALESLYEKIVIADFSDTAISDKSAIALARMDRVRNLRLAGTKVSDVVVQSIASLPSIQVLTVADTLVTEESLKLLRERGVRVYTGD